MSVSRVTHRDLAGQVFNAAVAMNRAIYMQPNHEQIAAAKRAQRQERVKALASLLVQLSDEFDLSVTIAALPLEVAARVERRAAIALGLMDVHRDALAFEAAMNTCAQLLEHTNICYDEARAIAISIIEAREAVLANSVDAPQVW